MEWIPRNAMEGCTVFIFLVYWHPCSSFSKRGRRWPCTRPWRQGVCWSCTHLCQGQIETSQFLGNNLNQVSRRYVFFDNVKPRVQISPFLHSCTFSYSSYSNLKRPLLDAGCPTRGLGEQNKNGAFWSQKPSVAAKFLHKLCPEKDTLSLTLYNYLFKKSFQIK